MHDWVHRFFLVLSYHLLLTEENITKIIESSLDRLFISVDGAEKETFERIRVGADFEKVVTNIKLVNSLKEKLSSSKPNVCFSTTLMRSNIEEFVSIIQLAHELKIKTISCKPIQILFPENVKEDLNYFPDLTRNVVAEAQEVSRQLGVNLECTPDLLSIIGDRNRCRVADNQPGKKNNARRCGEHLPILFIFPKWQGETLYNVER